MSFNAFVLERCLDDEKCPLQKEVVKNIKFLIGLRHEIEHQMTTRIDDLLSARFQACCINYHEAIVYLFGKRYGIAKNLAFSLQFASLGRAQIETLDQHPGLPDYIKRFIIGFDETLSAEEFASSKFAYRVLFIPKTVNHPNQADQVITFVKADSEIAKTINAKYAVIKETERPKWLPSQIVAQMNSEGFRWFKMSHHTSHWKDLNAKESSKGYGVQIVKTWYWYENWVNEVRKYCREKSEIVR